ncbi:hypothetical protein BZA77DRAFT_51094 [Pyronema omphalodes]|nr:hypothetical protein BZA77DRAFT_51094 [Pyronema omphalodes]
MSAFLILKNAEDINKMPTNEHKKRSSTYPSRSDTEVDDILSIHGKYHRTTRKKQKLSNERVNGKRSQSLKIQNSTRIDIPDEKCSVFTAIGGISLGSCLGFDKDTNIQFQFDDDECYGSGSDEITDQGCQQDGKGNDNCLDYDNILDNKASTSDVGEITDEDNQQHRKGNGKCLAPNNTPERYTNEQLDRNTPTSTTSNRPNLDDYTLSDQSNNVAWDLGSIPRFTLGPTPDWVICTKDDCPVALVPELRWDQHMAQVHQLALCNKKHGSVDCRMVDLQGYSFIAGVGATKGDLRSLRLDCGAIVERPGGCLVAKDRGGRLALFGPNGTCNPSSWKRSKQHEVFSEEERMPSGK